MLIQYMADVYKPRKSQSPPPKLFHMSMNGSSGIPRQVFLPSFIIFVVIIIIVDTTIIIVIIIIIIVIGIVIIVTKKMLRTLWTQ